MSIIGNLQNDRSQRAALQALLNKVGEVVNAREYSHPTDSSFHLAVQRAVDARAASGGGAVWIPSDEYDFLGGSRIIAKNKNVVIFGDGMGATPIQQNSTNNCFTRSANSVTNIRFLELRDFTIIGEWESDNSLGTDNDRGISIHFVDVCHVRNIEVLYMRQVSIKVGSCGEVLIDGCRVQYGARGAIICTPSSRVKVANCTIRHCNDDAIAVDTVTSVGDSANWGHIITGNFIEDSYGIKLLGAVKGIVANNQCHRGKAYALKVDDEAGTDEGITSVLGLTVANNIFHDTINNNLFHDVSSQLNPVYIGSRDTAQLPVEYGSPPTINKPEDFVYQSNNEDNERTAGEGITVSNNDIRQTLPEGGTYSDWGFGELFYKTGWLDPEVAVGAHIRAGSGIILNGAHNGTVIASNRVYGYSRCVRFVSPLSMPGAEPISIKNNRFVRFLTCGIGNSEGSDFVLPVVSEGNYFDGDPYFESDRRTSPLDGTWQVNSTYPVAIDATHHEYIVSDGDTYRNIFSHLQRTDTSSQFMIRRSKVIGDCIQFKGIGEIGKLPVAETQFVFEDSDPRSNTYGQPLRSGLAFNNSHNPPIRGCFVANQVAQRTVLLASTLTGYGVVTSGAASEGAWASGQTYTVPTNRTNGSSKVYTLITAGGGTTANEPVHDYGTVTGGDGYVWRFEAPAVAVFKSMPSLGA